MNLIPITRSSNLLCGTHACMPACMPAPTRITHPYTHMTAMRSTQVCMCALPRLLDGNAPAKAQALQYGLLPLLVHLLRSSPVPTTIAAAAHTLAVLSVRDSELQGTIASTGGLGALLDRLDPDAAVTQAAAAAAAAAADAAASAAAAAVLHSTDAKGLSHEPGAGTCVGNNNDDDDNAAPAETRDGNILEASRLPAPPETDGKQQQQQQQHVDSTPQQAVEASQQHMMPPPAAAVAASIMQLRGVAHGAAETAVTPGKGAGAISSDAAAGTQDHHQDKGTTTKAAAALQRRVATLRVRAACLDALAALAADNVFVKNAARSQGALRLLAVLLQEGHEELEAALMQQQQQHQVQSVPMLQHTTAWPTPLAIGGTPQHSVQRTGSCTPPAVTSASAPLVLQAACSDALASCVRTLAELVRGNHASQAAAAGEGLLEALAGLTALSLGRGLPDAAHHVRLLAGAATALEAACALCTPNKLAAREAGALEVLSRPLLAAWEVRRRAPMLP